MKIILKIILLIFYSSNASNYFCVEEFGDGFLINSDKLKKTDSNIKSDDFIKDSYLSERSIRTFGTFIDFTDIKADEIELISELLEFEGDHRKSIYENNATTLITSSLFTDTTCNKFTLSIQALIFINRVFYKDYRYDRSTILIDENNVTHCENSNNIDEAYKSYKKWFLIVKNNGVEYVKRNNIYPLDFCQIKWLK